LRWYWKAFLTSRGNEKPPGPEAQEASASTYVVLAHRRRRPVVAIRIEGILHNLGRNGDEEEF
jgi:hypothetical protein